MSTTIFFMLLLWFGLMAVLALFRFPHLVVYFLLGFLVFTLTASTSSVLVLKTLELAQPQPQVRYEDVMHLLLNEAILTAVAYLLLSLFIGFGLYALYYHIALGRYLRLLARPVRALVSMAVLMAAVAASLLYFVQPVLPLTVPQVLVFCVAGAAGVGLLPFTRRSFLLGVAP